MSTIATGLGGGAIYHEMGILCITNSNFSSNDANGESGSGAAVLSASGVTAIKGGLMVTGTLPVRHIFFDLDQVSLQRTGKLPL